MDFSSQRGVPLQKWCSTQATTELHAERYSKVKISNVALTGKFSPSNGTRREDCNARRLWRDSCRPVLMVSRLPSLHVARFFSARAMSPSSRRRQPTTPTSTSTTGLSGADRGKHAPLVRPHTEPHPSMVASAHELSRRRNGHPRHGLLEGHPVHRPPRRKIPYPKA